MQSKLILVVLLSGLSAAVLYSQSTPSPALLVLSKGGNSLAIVDPSTLQVVGRVPAGPDPHEVVASSDGRTAYISNYGFGAYHTILVIDLVAQKTLQPIDLGVLRGPHGLAFVGGKLYFTAEVNKLIGRYDPSTKKIDWLLGTGQNRTHMVWVSKSLDRIYTSNVSSATVTIIEKTHGPAGGFRPPPHAPGGPGSPLRRDWNETVVAVGRGSEGFDVSPEGKELWVGNAQDGTISIISLARKAVVQTLQANVMGVNRLKFTPNGNDVFVSSLSNGNLTVIDAASRQVIKRIKLGHGAAGILMQPDGSRAFVACSPDDTVAVIDLRTLSVAGRIQAGRQPDGLAWAVRH